MLDFDWCIAGSLMSFVTLDVNLVCSPAEKCHFFYITPKSLLKFFSHLILVPIGPRQHFMLGGLFPPLGIPRNPRWILR